VGWDYDAGMCARVEHLLLVMLVALSCCACTREEPVIELTKWTLLTPSGERREVTVPVRFSDADLDARGHALLEGRVSVPVPWRRGPLTLAVVGVIGRASLATGGRTIPSIDLGYSQAWSLSADAASAEPLSLALDLDVRALPSLPVSPRLSPTDGGDITFRHSRDFDFFSGVVSMSALGLTALIYAALFALDRRRAEHAWVAIQATLSIPVAAAPTGVTLALMPWTNVVQSFCALAAALGGAAFVRRYFGRARVASGWLAAFGVLVILAAFLRTPNGRTAVVALTVVVVVAVFASAMTMLARESTSGPDRTPAIALAVAWTLLLSSATPDMLVVSGWGDPTAGIRFIAVGLVVYAVIQVLILGRDHIRSLREAEARVKDLEAQRREVGALNEELRRQVAERSRELTEALARTEGIVAPAVLEVGDVFDGRYRVAKALGRGGMGAVFEVERTRDGRRLALKVVTAALQAKQAARFAREAEIGARLQHENLVSIVDVGIAGGITPFLVMELVPGGSLEDRRARFGDAKWALPILRQIATGLAELHANSVVHRDLKPGNVLLVEKGGVNPLAKISDFGISRFGALDDSGDVDVEAATVSPSAQTPKPRDLTETGAIMGTPIYMPPEAGLGPASHPSADLFSLGVLAYEALTGRFPFALPPALLARARQPIPVPAPLDGVDATIAALVLACLRVEPNERPRARGLADQLGRYELGADP
jgi:hypothetical protein